MAKPPPLLSTENSMTIVFISDRSVNGAGFSATYQAIDASMDCDRTFTAQSGRIEFDPNLHPRATKCDYHILVGDFRVQKFNARSASTKKRSPTWPGGPIIRCSLSTLPMYSRVHMFVIKN